MAIGERNLPIFDIVTTAKAVELFTPKQIQIIELLIRGKTNEEIAVELNITSQTVKNHLSGGISNTDSRLNRGIFGIIEEHTGIRVNRTGAIYMLIDMGVLSLTPSNNQKD